LFTKKTPISAYEKDEICSTRADELFGELTYLNFPQLIEPEKQLEKALCREMIRE